MIILLEDNNLINAPAAADVGLYSINKI